MDIIAYTFIWILIGIAKQCIMHSSEASLTDVQIDQMLITALKGPFS